MTKELLRSCLRNWKQLISIIAISFLALCLFCGLTSNATNIANRATHIYQVGNYPDVFVTTTNLSAEDQTALGEMEGVEKVETRMYAPAKVDSTIVFLIGADPDSTLSTPSLVEGERGVVITPSMAQVEGVGIGDYITVNIAADLLTPLDFYKPLFDTLVLKTGSNIFRQDSIPFQFKVTGIGYHPEGVQSAAFSTSLIYCDMDALVDNLIYTMGQNYSLPLLSMYMEPLGMTIEGVIDEMIPALVNQALITSSNPEATIAAIQDYFASGATSSFLVSAQSGDHYGSYMELKQEQDQSIQLTYVFPIIFFLVSILVILTTLSQMIIKQRSQIGAMKAIGVPRWRLYLNFSMYGALTCAIGAILGFGIGPVLIPRVLSIKYDILWDLPQIGIRFFLPASIAMCVVTIAAAALCSVLVSWSVIREKPVDTLRPKTGHAEKKSTRRNAFFDRIPLELKMSLRNIKRNWGKSLMVVLGMMGCSGLLVCGFGIMDTINYDVDRDLNHNMTFDALVITLDPNPLLKYNIQHTDGVDKAEELYMLNATVAGENTISTNFVLVEPDSEVFNQPVGVDGGVSMNEVTAEKAGLKIGDELTISVDGHAYTRTLTSTFQSSIFNGVYELCTDYPEGTFMATGYAIKAQEGTDIEDLMERLEEVEGVAGVRGHDWLMSIAERAVSTISVMTNVVEVFAILLSIVVIYNLTSLNITSRHREIATLKVLGFRYHEIRRTLTIEMMIDTVVGALLGLAIGFPMVVIVMVTNTTELFNFIYHIQWYTYIMSFAIAAVTALVVSLILCLKAKTISMSESLKSVE